MAHKELHAQARREYEEAKSLFATNLEKDVDDFKETIKANVKDWKTSYRNARNLTALRREARRFGCNVVPTDEGSSAAEKTLFKQYALTPLEVDGRDLSAEPPTPQDTPYSTPPNLPTSLPDLNVTPTQVRTKRHRIEEPAIYPPLSDALFLPATTPAQTPLAVSIPLPMPMDEDLDYALEVHTDHLYRTGGSIHTSIHAPSPGINHPSRAHNPSATPQGAPRDAQSGGQPTAPIPAPLRNVGSTLEESVSAPRPQQTDPLAAILAAINATIQGLKSRIADRLDVQDKRIEALTTLTRPAQPLQPPPSVAAKRAKGQGAVAAAPDPNTRSNPSKASETPVPVPRVDDPASHDHVEEIQTQGVQSASEPTLTGHTTVLREAFQPPPEKHVRLNVDSHGKPTPATSMPPSWASVITKTATAQQNRSAGQAKEVTSGTFRSSAGKARPETVARCKLTGNTEATVIRHHGLEDIAFKMTIRKMTPASIINETRSEVDRLTGGKVVLLSGRWSSNKNKNIHNFVYTFKGQIPFRSIYPLRDVLVKPLMTGHLVPNDGWTFAQIRDTTTSGPDGTVFSGTQLESELRRNPAFEDAIFCIAPHWQGSMHRVSTSPKGTVKFAYVDEDGKVTARAKRNGVFLFNERTRFVPTGDVATIILCGRCHRIGHATDSTACPLPANAVRCFICGGSHHSNDHAAHCPNQHDKVGECRCLFPCINCGGGHNARSPQCKLKMGFTPPDLAPPPDSPATPAPSAKGKARAAPPEDLVPTQREQTAPVPLLEADAPFTPVTKKSRNQRRRANAAAARTTAKPATGPSSTPPAALMPTSTPTPGTSAAATSGKKTSVVPARPVQRFPTPPTWKEAPVIYKRHVATDQECEAALRRIFKHEPTPEELRTIHVAWGGHESDEEITALWTLHFRWAVKYGLPLTTQAARSKIVYEGKYGIEETLKRFEEDWGAISPRMYLLSKIPHEQYFSHPGDLEEEIINPETAAHNRNMARILVQTILKYKTMEATAHKTAPPPTHHRTHYRGPP
ncbi:hypothetical protein EDB86DRAFT_3082675 [Lactarius hatsudake]|nr:hypothetical protein EDB86DRAFT_3082675 [Lactarius hatsudake]